MSAFYTAKTLQNTVIINAIKHIQISRTHTHTHTYTPSALGGKREREREGGRKGEREREGGRERETERFPFLKIARVFKGGQYLPWALISQAAPAMDRSLAILVCLGLSLASGESGRSSPRAFVFERRAAFEPLSC